MWRDGDWWAQGVGHLSPGFLKKKNLSKKERGGRPSGDGLPTLGMGKGGVACSPHLTPPFVDWNRAPGLQNVGAVPAGLGFALGEAGWEGEFDHQRWDEPGRVPRHTLYTCPGQWPGGSAPMPGVMPTAEPLLQSVTIFHSHFPVGPLD